MRLFESGDRIVFLSTPFFREDTFARLLRNFYFTRFPGIRLETFQSVLPPGNAELMQTLLKKEVIAGEVTGAVLHFDIRDFAPDPHMLFAPGEAGHAQRIQAMTRYHDTVEDAVKRLAEAGIPALLLSPLPPGRSRLRSGGQAEGDADDLADRCVEISARLAECHGMEFLDVLVPMRKLAAAMRENTDERRKDDLRKTPPAPDDAPPDLPSYAVMTSLFLEAQKAPRRIFSAELGFSCVEENCSVSEIRMEESGPSFHLTLFALPYPPFEERAEADRRIAFSEKWNHMRLAVRGISRGVYTLFVNGACFQEFSSEELEQGIRLDLKSPRSERIGELNRMYEDLQIQLRGLSPWNLRAAEKESPDKTAAREESGFQTGNGEEELRTRLRILSEELRIPFRPDTCKLELKRIGCP